MGVESRNILTSLRYDSRIPSPGRCFLGYICHVVSLDALISQYGEPSRVEIKVESVQDAFSMLADDNSRRDCVFCLAVLVRSHAAEPRRLWISVEALDGR